MQTSSRGLGAFYLAVMELLTSLSPQQVNQAYTYIHKLYREFIGLPHFQAICQLLGYQGIALIVEGMLESIKSRVIFQQVHSIFNFVFYHALKINLKSPSLISEFCIHGSISLR